MATPAPAFPVNDREFYPLHAEDDVPETEFHELQTTYLRGALRAQLPHRHVTGNICIYWVPGNTDLYRAPDVFVAEGPAPEAPLRVYHTWQDPPILFVAEIGSRSTFREDEEPKLEIYSRDIQATEYLYANPPRGDLRLWRLGLLGYEPVTPGANGRLRSAVLDLEFGLEDGWLWIYTLEGERLRTHEQEKRRVQELERRLAELQAEPDRQRPKRRGRRAQPE